MGEPRGEGERFPALDGLRAFASSAVIWHHVGPRGTFFDRNFGVNTFFTISGFLITTLLLREQARTGDVSVRGFYVRRAVRIAPLYYGVLLLYVALAGWAERDLAARARFFADLPYFATFTANWVLSEAAGTRVIMMFAWSLSTQEQFYVVWPWVVKALRRRRMVVLVLVAILVVVEVRWLPLAQTDAIWIGSLVAFLYRTRRGQAALRVVAGGAWSAPAALAAVLLPLGWRSCPALETAVATGWLVTACALRPGILRRLLENRLARWMGSVSYATYLLHMLAVNAARRLVPGSTHAATFAVALGIAFAAGAAAHRLVDPAAARLRARLLSPPARAPEHAPA